MSATEELQMTDERQPTTRRGMSAVPPSQSSANEEQLPPPPRPSSGGEIQGTIARPVMVPASEPALNSPLSEEMNFETWSSRVFALLGTAGLQGAVSRIAPPRGSGRPARATPAQSAQAVGIIYTNACLELKKAVGWGGSAFDIWTALARYAYGEALKLRNHICRMSQEPTLSLSSYIELAWGYRQQLANYEAVDE